MGRTRVYVGGIPKGTRERDLERFFQDFGRLKEIILKNEFAFVEFESSRDAEDAIIDMNDKKLLGKRVSVEVAHGKPRGRDRCTSRGYNDDYRYRGEHRRPIRTKHRLIVENLSSAISWQALKDCMRQAGEVSFCDAHKQHPNVGEVEFASRSDLKAAIKLLDGTELNGRRIRLVEDGQAKRDRSTSSSRLRNSRSRNSRSLSRGLRRRTRSRSRSRSPSRIGSHRRARSSSRDRPKSSYSAKRYQNRSSTSGSSRSRSRSGSVKRAPVRKNLSRSRSRSSRCSEDSKKRARSRSHSDSPTKRLKLVEEFHGHGSESHTPEAKNISPSTTQPAHVQESSEVHTSETGI